MEPLDQWKVRSGFYRTITILVWALRAMEERAINLFDVNKEQRYNWAPGSEDS